MQIKNITVLRWCTYGHFVGETCVYVGFGLLPEAFDLKKRHPAWWRATKNKDIDVTIFEQFTRQDQAEEMARTLLIVLRPAGNVGNTGLKGGRPAIPVRCVETGVIYAKPSLAAAAAGVSLNTMKACLYGRMKTAGGKRWVRDIPLA